jgi:hypothetical protein
MPFHSWDAYRHYESSVLHNLRYIHEESVRDFLRAVQKLPRLGLKLYPLERSFGGPNKAIHTDWKTKDNWMRWRFHALSILSG